jgi:DNA-directed RNA polymerase specialized sigma24 family protein
MLDPEKLATIRRLYYAEHWKIGTIAAELGVHRDTVRARSRRTRCTVRGGCG